MKYIGIAEQQRNNNIRSLALLLCFPLLVVALLYMSCFILGVAGYKEGDVGVLFAFVNLFILSAVAVCVVYFIVGMIKTPIATILITIMLCFIAVGKGALPLFTDHIPAILSPVFNVFLSILPRIVILSIVWFVFAYFAKMHVLLLAIFLALSYMGCFVSMYIGSNPVVASFASDLFFAALPYVILITLTWFAFAYFLHTQIIESLTNSHALERRENKRVYNLVENLCISCGMAMPRVCVIENKALNAFASGINASSYTITLTRGIIDALDDRELRGVIAHELTHIRNNDARVMVIAIIFAGIFDRLLEWILHVGNFMDKASDKGKGDPGKFYVFVLPVMLVPFSIGYGLSMLMRFAISRNREFMADAGAADLTRDPKGLASALRKIAGNSDLGFAKEDVAQLFIEHKPSATGLRAMFAALYAPHPPIWDRIGALERF
jgi:heat shock protein HtpX